MYKKDVKHRDKLKQILKIFLSGVEATMHSIDSNRQKVLKKSSTVETYITHILAFFKFLNENCSLKINSNGTFNIVEMLKGTYFRLFIIGETRWGYSPHTIENRCSALVTLINFSIEMVHKVRAAENKQNEYGIPRNSNHLLNYLSDLRKFFKQQKKQAKNCNLELLELRRKTEYWKNRGEWIEFQQLIDLGTKIEETLHKQMNNWKDEYYHDFSIDIILLLVCMEPTFS